MDSIQDNVTADLSVQGTAANDSFQFTTNNGANSITVNVVTAVNYANKTGLAILGQGGKADRITLSGDLNSAGDIDLGQANQLTGPLTLTATSGSVVLANASDTNFASVAANSLTWV